jgi:hypothetical protein
MVDLLPTQKEKAHLPHERMGSLIAIRRATPLPAQRGPEALRPTLSGGLPLFTPMLLVLVLLSVQ